MEFYCYIDGHRFDSASLNISSGGAFLQTDADIRPGAMLMVVPKKEAQKEFPVAVFGKVARRQSGASEGLGVKWVSCVTRHGIHCIYKFFESYPELSGGVSLPQPTPEAAASALVGFCYSTRKFYIPKMAQGAQPHEGPARRSRSAPRPRAGGRQRPRSRPQAATSSDPPTPPPPSGSGEKYPGHTSGTTGKFTSDDLLSRQASDSPWTPKRPATPEPAPQPPPEPANARPSRESSRAIDSPPRFRRTEEPGPLTVALSAENRQIPVELPVTFRCPGHKFEGTIRVLGLSNLFLECDAKAIDEVGKHKVEVKLEVPLHHGTYAVRLTCNVVAKGNEPHTGVEGLVLHITAVEQPRKPGLFERYVKYLYYHMIAT